MTFVAPAPNSDGYTCSLTLVDEAKLEVDCNMSHSDLAYLPPSMSPGDILCLRKVMVEGHQRHVALKANTLSRWMMFIKKKQFKPLTSYIDVKLGSTEKSRVAQLKTWSSQECGCIRKKPCTTFVCALSVN